MDGGVYISRILYYTGEVPGWMEGGIYTEYCITPGRYQDGWRRKYIQNIVLHRVGARIDGGVYISRILYYTG